MADKKKDVKGLSIEIKLDEKISAQLDRSMLTLKGPKGEVKRDFPDKRVAISHKEDTIILKAPKLSKTNKKIVNSYAAHIKNMANGVLESYKYTLKICSGHFPMNVSVSSGQFIVKNFLGEKVPRTLKLKAGAQVKVEGEVIVVEGPDKEIAGQVSADIELLTRRTKYDTRIFQDGIWITSKCGKEMK